MNELLQKILDQIKAVWTGWTTVQRIIFFSIVGAVIVGVVLLVTLNAQPGMIPLLQRPITDEAALSRIAERLDAEGVAYQITADKRILVPDQKIAKNMRAILVREELLPSGTDPWELFDLERWTLTDFERNVNLRRAITESIEQHIEALSDIDNASVTLVMPEKDLFIESQDPVTASIILTPKPGSDIVTNRKKIQGIVKLVQFAVQGLKEENITITDQSGVVLNDFAGMADFDRLELAKREMKVARDLEGQYKKSIMNALKSVYGGERVQVINMDITLDTSRRSIETEEHFPITVMPDNPRTPFDESAQPGGKVLSITLSKEVNDERFEGTGFNPEGPPGQEGQTPPAYKDLEGMVGRYSRSSVVQNEVVNTRRETEERAPWEIRRVTIAVALDGVWKWKYNEQGEVVLNPDGSIAREYVPVTDEDIGKARALIEHAVGFNRDRGDAVTVQHVQFDRSSQFRDEDQRFRAEQQVQRTIIAVLVAIAVLLIAFIVFRLISRELERRRRLRDEEAFRQHQAIRDAALRAAEAESAEVEMSVEDRARMELQEHAINIAREHPEDVAQLIRTWIMEE